MSRTPDWLDPRTLRWVADRAAARANRARGNSLFCLRSRAYESVESWGAVERIHKNSAAWLRGVATDTERRRAKKESTK